MLLRLCDCRFPPPYGGPPQEVPLTQAEFAATSNVSRNTLGTLLRSLQDAGLVLIGYGKIRPLQSEKLRALVEAGSAWRESGAGDGNRTHGIRPVRRSGSITCERKQVRV